MTRMRPRGRFPHDVLRLQITVDDADVMRRLQRPAHLLNDRNCFLRSKLGPLMDDGGEIFALDILHRDELYPLRFAQVINTDDIAVGDLGGEDQFLFEAVENGTVAGQVRANHFQGHHAAQLNVLGFVNGAHAAFAQQAQYLIAVRQQVPGGQDSVALTAV